MINKYNLWLGYYKFKYIYCYKDIKLILLHVECNLFI